jgi:hypothetical protein
MKRVLKLTGWCAAIVVVWTSTPALAAADAFAQHFALQLAGGAAYYSLTLPAVVYAASERADLGDVRIVNGAGESLPYSLDTPRVLARMQPRLRSVNWFPLPPAATGGNSTPPPGVMIGANGALFATSAPPALEQHDTDLIDTGRVPRTGQIDALLVHLRDDNYQGRVTVESSDDLRHWQPAGDAQLLKVNYNGSTLSQDRIDLPGTHARYLRLHWLDGAPYVDSMDTEIVAAGTDPVQRFDTQREWREGITAYAGPKAGEYFFTTGGAYPVDRLRLSLPQPNTVAPAVVYSRAGLTSPWRQVASATLFRLHNGTVEQHNESLEMKPDTDHQWRIVVDTRNGGLGSGALSVAAGWRPATLTFAARGSAPFALAVGNATLVSAAISREALLGGASSSVATARLADALPTAPVASAPLTPAGDGKRGYLLWAALLLAVGSLGAIGWWLARGAQLQAGDVPSGLAGTSGAVGAMGGEGAVPTADEANDSKR